VLDLVLYHAFIIFLRHNKAADRYSAVVAAEMNLAAGNLEWQVEGWNFLG